MENSSSNQTVVNWGQLVLVRPNIQQRKLYLDMRYLVSGDSDHGIGGNSNRASLTDTKLTLTTIALKVLKLVNAI